MSERTYSWSNPISELVFLDRYAIKDHDGQLAPGDIVVTLVKDDPKFPVKEVGKVVSVDGDTASVEIRSTGEVITQVRSKIDKPLETHPVQMWDRMARAIAKVEPYESLWCEQFFRALEDFKFVPAGRINTMLGTGQNLTAYNCYVIPFQRNDGNPAIDSRQAIIDTLGNMVEIMSRGGGVGLNLSCLRPRLARVFGVNGRSSGSVSWGGLFSFATGLVEQGGSRRGALMLILNDWHPDILEFIDAKRDMGAITNANISVGISDAFMTAVKNDDVWHLIFPDTSDSDYDRLWDGNITRWINELNKPFKVYKTVRAREMWNKIIESAWSSAEPGVVFIDRMNKMSNSWYYADIIATNPCGEQGLPGWGVCNLGHINLSRFVKGPIGRGEVDWDGLAKTVRIAVRFLDNIIDITPYFREENERLQKNERRIGLGTMGLGEMLIRCGLRYGSEESVQFIDRLYRTIAVEAYKTSIDLAVERGPFPYFDHAKHVNSGFMQHMMAHLPEEYSTKLITTGIRNVTLITQAPTGSVGTMVGTSTGIEPFYSWTYWRNSRLGMKEVEESIVTRWRAENGKSTEDSLPDYFVNAMELTPKEHVVVQAAVQKWTDSSISKTANAPNDFTVEETRELYEYAYALGCKGVTIYRDGSRDQQVLSVKNDDQSAPPQKDDASNSAKREDPVEKKPLKRPQKLQGVTYEWRTPLGKAFITLNERDGVPIETFVNVGKAGSDVTAASEALGRLVTLFLRHHNFGDHREAVAVLIKHLIDIGGGQSIGFGANRISSVPDAIAKTLKDWLDRADGEWVDEHAEKTRSPISDLCPVCGVASFVKEEGCQKCRACGYSRC